MSELSAILGFIESRLNQQLGQSLDAQSALKKFHGHHIVLDVLASPIVISLFIHSYGVRILPVQDTPAPLTTIRASALSLIRMAKGYGVDTEVSIDGDVRAVNGLKKAVSACDFSIEELLAQCIGDTPALLLCQLADKGQQWVKRHQTTLEHAIGLYIQQEIECAPAPIEVDNFMNDVDIIRADVDRLSVRLQQLESRDKGVDVHNSTQANTL